ncbi:MAG TPA: CAP domain-containing protein [Thermomicrobiaceae bacterium]|nr:CAP domain-containing protein [Thermomicrobiaceae bacterium]
MVATPYGPQCRPGVARLLQVAAALALALMPLLTLPAAPATAATDELTQAFNEINTYRSWLGLPPMHRSAALDASASAHAQYYALNYGDPSLSGMGLHAETPGKPGFTGADMQARAQAAGYSGWVNENIGLSGSMLVSLDWFIGTINHRLTLIDPRYVDIGLGAVNNGTAKIEVIDVGAPTWSDTATPNWVAWPPDGTTGVGLSFDGETPDPFPAASYPVGYPITLKYLGPGSVSFQQATLTTGGTSVPVDATTGSGWLTQQTYQIAATRPLAPGTTYRVTASGTANGAPFTRTWSFRTAATSDEPLALGVPADTTLPPGVAAADPAVQQLWWQSDGTLQAQSTDQTWLWGPDTWAAPKEPYAQSPGGSRRVYYFDKSRMEISQPGGDRSSPWFVTNGLLVRDMILGAIQTGDSTFEQSQPAQIPIAGDPAPQNPNAPTYASLHGLATLANDHHVPNLAGQAVTAALDRAGNVTTGKPVPGGVTLTGYDAVTGHNIASVFTDYFAAQTWDPIYVAGRPLTEPYWVYVNVKGTPQWVLVQAFERRVMTYTPGNPAGWQVEMGNVGRAYYQWRYGQTPTGP